jgi:hypothetical protein
VLKLHCPQGASCRPYSASLPLPGNGLAAAGSVWWLLYPASGDLPAPPGSGDATHGLCKASMPLPAHRSPHTGHRVLPIPGKVTQGQSHSFIFLQDWEVGRPQEPGTASGQPRRGEQCWSAFLRVSVVSATGMLCLHTSVSVLLASHAGCITCWLTPGLWSWWLLSWSQPSYFLGLLDL